MKILVALLCCLSGIAAADTVRISGSVVDTQGLGVANAVVSLAGTAHDVGGSGEFVIDAPSADEYQLHISADGYFSFVQTFTRADLALLTASAAALDVPPIALVERRPGRHLLVFAGDTMMGRRFVTPRIEEPVLIRAETAADDMREILQHAKPYFDLADFASVNLETQLSDTEPPDALPKSVTFFTFTDIAAALKWAGVDYAALGNNHTFDYREVGLARTVDALNDAGLAYSGAGHTSADARMPHATSIGKQRLDLLSYVGWPGTLEAIQVAQERKGGAAYGTTVSIAEDLAAIADTSMAVVQYHSGLEYESYPPLAEETQLKLAIDRGADLAVGHHSHVFQGFEIYKDRLIAYSLGNFVFDQYLYSTQSSILLFAWYDEDKFFRAEIVPMHINGYVPTPASGQIRFDILQRLARLSDSDDVCWSLTGAHAAFEACSPDLTAAEPLAVTLPGSDSLSSILRLSTLKIDPLRPIEKVHAAGQYRLGVDILRRGDFEHSGLFGTQDRSWIEHERVAVVEQDTMLMKMSIPGGESVDTGMRVFTRVFTRSAPATVSGRIRSNGCTNLSFAMQRRPDGMSFSDALLSGPITEIGKASTSSGEWADFEIDLAFPRTFTRAIRLLINGMNCDVEGRDVELELDDLALIEWQTPWYSSGDPIDNYAGTQATHLQLRRHSPRL